MVQGRKKPGDLQDDGVLEGAPGAPPGRDPGEWERLHWRAFVSHRATPARIDAMMRNLQAEHGHAA